MKKFFKVAGIILGGLIGLIIVVHIILNITFSIQLKNKINELKAQGKPTTIAEIIPPPVPDEENAAILYNKAFALMESQKEGTPSEMIDTIERVASFSGLSEWTEEQRKEIPQLINSKEMQDIYELLKEGSQTPKCNFNLEYEKGPYTLSSHRSFIAGAVRLLCAKALLEAESDKVEKAFDTLLIGLKISDHLKDEPVLTSQWVRIICDGIIIECMKGIIDSEGVPPKKATLIMDELSTHLDVSPFIKCMDGERVAYGGWVFERILQGKIEEIQELPHNILTSFLLFLGKPIFKKNFVCYLTLMSKMQDGYHLPYYKVPREIKNNPIDEQIPIYCIFTRLLLPEPYRLQVLTAKHQANIEICRVGLALKIYKTKTGAYPEKLENLTPNLLTEIPIDPFSGKNLIYNKSEDGFNLYSFCPNTPSVSRRTIIRGSYNPTDNKDYYIGWKCEK